MLVLNQPLLTIASGEYSFYPRPGRLLFTCGNEEFIGWSVQYHGPRIISMLSCVNGVVGRYFIWMKNEPSQKETLRRICATAWVPERAFYLGTYVRNRRL
jgi:hypothetical protein